MSTFEGNGTVMRAKTIHVLCHQDMGDENVGGGEGEGQEVQKEERKESTTRRENERGRGRGREGEKEKGEVNLECYSANTRGSHNL